MVNAHDNGHMDHVYISTACAHDIHTMCRRHCKFCHSACLCLCHERQRRARRDRAT